MFEFTDTNETYRLQKANPALHHSESVVIQWIRI